MITLFSLSVLCIPLLWLNRKGRTTLSSILLSLIVLMVINVNIWDGDGIRDSAILAYPIFIMVSILFLDKRTAPLFSFVAIGSLITLTYFEIHGYVQPTIGAAGYDNLIPMVILLVIAATVTWVVAGNLEGNLDRIKKSEGELRKNYDLTLEAWAKVLEYRDKETEGHSRRLVELSTRLARELNFSEEEIVYLRRGALLHDIGKLAIPDIIRTATNLLPPELEIVRIVDIVGLDTQADGGTHVASTRQIGGIEVVKVENKGKGFRRLRIRLTDG